MKMIKTTMMLGFLLMGSCFPQTVRGETVTMTDSAGEQAYLEVSLSDQFLDVFHAIESYCDGQELSWGRILLSEQVIFLRFPMLASR